MTPFFSQILIIYQPGRKRDNLAVLLASILPDAQIVAAGDFRGAAASLSVDRSVLVIIGPCQTSNELGEAIRNIHRANPCAKVLQMVSQPQDLPGQTNVATDGVLYDGFSSRTLAEMLSHWSGLGKENRQSNPGRWMEGTHLFEQRGIGKPGRGTSRKKYS
jgi:hypothetical protein